MPDKKKIIAASLAGVLIAGMAGGYAWYASQPKPHRPAAPRAAKSVPQSTESKPLAVKTEDSRGTVSVPSIMEFDPSTVYSGSLGEMTGLLAGRELSKVAFDMKQNEIRLKELEGKLHAEQPVFLAPPVPVTTEQPGVAGTASVKQEPERMFVASVMGGTGNLKALLRSRTGRYLVQVGDMVPGLGRVSGITPERVEIEHHPLPWM